MFCCTASPPFSPPPPLTMDTHVSPRRSDVVRTHLPQPNRCLKVQEGPHALARRMGPFDARVTFMSVARPVWCPRARISRTLREAYRLLPTRLPPFLRLRVGVKAQQHAPPALGPGTAVEGVSLVPPVLGPTGCVFILGTQKGREQA